MRTETLHPPWRTGDLINYTWNEHTHTRSQRWVSAYSLRGVITQSFITRLHLSLCPFLHPFLIPLLLRSLCFSVWTSKTLWGETGELSSVLSSASSPVASNSICVKYHVLYAGMYWGVQNIRDVFILFTYLSQPILYNLCPMWLKA